MARSAAETACSDRLSADDAGMWENTLRLPECLVACSRAEAHIQALARDENLVALVAGECAAGEAVSLGGLCEESFLAATALAEQAAVGESRSHRDDERRIDSPDFVVGIRVAGTTHRREIVERVRALVIGEQSERSDMVNGDVLRATADRATMPVAFQRGSSLSRPTGATVSGVSASPSRIRCPFETRHNIHSIWENR